MVNGQWSMVNGHIVNSHFIIYSPHTHHTPPLREALRVVPSGTLRERSRSWGTHRSPLPWGSGDWGQWGPLWGWGRNPLFCALSHRLRVYTLLTLPDASNSASLHYSSHSSPPHSSFERRFGRVFLVEL